MTIASTHAQTYGAPSTALNADDFSRASNNTKIAAYDEATAFANRLGDIPEENAPAAAPASIEAASESWVDKALEYMNRSYEVAVTFYNTPGHGMR